MKVKVVGRVGPIKKGTAKFQAGGRFVATMFNGYNSVQIGANTEDEMVETLRRLRAEGIKFVNLYSKAPTYWKTDVFELMDVNDPNGKNGVADRIMGKAFPGAVQ